jgi:hypothetical protein
MFTCLELDLDLISLPESGEVRRNGVRYTVTPVIVLTLGQTWERNMEAVGSVLRFAGFGQSNEETRTADRAMEAVTPNLRGNSSGSRVHCSRRPGRLAAEMRG